MPGSPAGVDDGPWFATFRPGSLPSVADRSLAGTSPRLRRGPL